jgi:hypothetical protein
MRKIIFVLATLMFAAPALAGVTICTQTSGNEVTLTYDASAEAELVRAFALDITVQGATITAVKNPNPSYDIYPGSIVIDENTGQVIEDGTPVGDAGQYEGTLGGLGTNGVTIEMGSLYADGETPPAKTGNIITLVLSGPGTVTVAENVIRGGVVMENPDVPSNCGFACGCPGDVDNTGQIDLEDLQGVASILLDVGSPFIADVTPETANGDVDGNGQIDLEDLQAVAAILLDVGTPFIVPCE